MLTRKGFALVVALSLMVVVAGVMTLVFTRTVTEVRHSGDDAAIVATLLLARGGANMGGAVLQGPVRDALEAIVQLESNSTGPWSFGSSAFGSPEPTPDSVIADLSNHALSVANQLQADIDTLLCDQVLATNTSSSVTVRIHVTAQACNLDLPTGIILPGGRFVAGLPRSGTGFAEEQTFALPYVLITEGRIGEFLRRVVVQGEFHFTVGRGSFARYALFTNEHLMENGGAIWFSDNTVVDGPVHTNQYLRLHHRPWFGDEVTSAGCLTPAATTCSDNNFSRQGANFFGQGFIAANNMNNPANPSYTNSYGTHEPDFAAGVDWSASFVPLPQNSLDQQAAAQRRGLFFGNDLYALVLWAGDNEGIPLNKDPDGNWVPEATFQYVRACPTSTSCTTYRYGEDRRLYRQNSDGSWPTQTVTDAFNGVLYVDGNVDRFRGPTRGPGDSNDPNDAAPAVASFGQLNLTTTGRVRITTDLTYEDQPCSGSPARNPDGTVTPTTCDNLAASNVLGVFSSGGDILIGHNNIDSSLNAPTDVAIQAVLMTSVGVVRVEDFDLGTGHGNVNLLGGIIEFNYGPFFTFDETTGSISTGFGRRFAYDQRMALGLAPPYFPTVGLDGVRSIRTFSFGQREQVF